MAILKWNKIPTTETGLREAGYEYENTGKCNQCDEDIAWYRTPQGKRIPLDEGSLELHFDTCSRR